MQLRGLLIIQIKGISDKSSNSRFFASRPILGKGPTLAGLKSDTTMPEVFCLVMRGKHGITSGRIHTARPQKPVWRPAG
jgi:hypothetical protein